MDKDTIMRAINESQTSERKRQSIRAVVGLCAIVFIACALALFAHMVTR